MARVFIESESLALPRIEIRGKEAHYVARVLRARMGERMILFDGAGAEADAVVARVSRRSVSFEVVSRRAVVDVNPLALTVLQACLQGDKAAWLVEKLVEIGVVRVVFFPGERSVRTRLPASRLERIAQAAARQSGRATVPVIEEAPSLGVALTPVANVDTDSFRVFCQPGGTRPIGEVIDAVANRSMSAPARGLTAFVAIGPEGGFTDAEEASLIERGFAGVRIGPRTLRAESAGVVVAAILMHRLGDLA